MVILRLTNPVQSEQEAEVVDSNASKEGARFVRPCERYREMLRECKSIRGRLHQYYVYGELLDCQPHKDNYDHCLQYRKSKDFSVLHQVIDWEKNLMLTRLNAEKQNTTWEYRTEPPNDFDGPLPEFLSKRQEAFKHW